MFKTFIEIVSVYGGYVGVFTISLVSNSIPFVGVPYLLVIASYIAREAVRVGLSAEIVLILLSALGSTIGKIFVYLIAAGFRFKLSDTTKDNLKHFANYSKKMVFPLIVLFAASPVPDDLLYVPLGVAGYSLPYYFLGIFVGKTIMVWLASTYFRVIFNYLGDEIVTNPLVAVPVVLLTAYLTITIIKMNWRRIAEVYTEKGVIPSIRVLLEEFAAANSKFLKKVFISTQGLRAT
ncbi:MAG: VTT domain-containing protein [Sulfolobales archaeon]|nr:VTT domain-containing protein [Sulfolobales archaeon]MDW8082313.1 VTT domain-containing protein [Sulfolobales archaeon]